jgi:hypothetical protein
VGFSDNDISTSQRLGPVKRKGHRLGRIFDQAASERYY